MLKPSRVVTGCGRLLERPKSHILALQSDDINMLALPGVIHELHSVVTNHAIDKVEDRADCFFILDGSSYGRSIDNAITDVKALD